ncbi:class I SAM-dependent RNA methyltransferase [Celeribacter indicus]|uniref:23S rRNA (Uracil-5-)-methyltransferase RumA n=1 Tax=Celeribacter indicus TaxID=1208324 RepID=A0A0B5DMW0_9RHOB|nr:class I SAM-dependent RNA methyltransferase [Celeribacter indicus]AJE44958.1 23S rRNA (uracil-5-)-methyltransferase RumA [Celeribacter indicus]SDW96242.1 23S rRNA m(5)U-1939 methyltransferase [Celeribacter indicus]
MRHEVVRLGHWGDGVTADGLFAANALPGEVVEGEREGDRIPDPKIVTPSPDRVRPPCRHYKACGGCALQHASDDFVASWKRGVVETALRHQGISAEIGPVHVSPPHSRRRAVFHGRRTKKGVLLGLHARASESVVAVPDCLLMTPEIMAGYSAFEDLVALGVSRRGEMDLAVISSEGGLDVAVTGARPLDLDLRVRVAEVSRAAGLARLSWNGEPVAGEGPAFLNFGRARVVPPAGAFLQATAEGEARLVDAMRRAVAGAGRIVDLFAGCGTFSLPLAQGAEVHAVEGVAEMLSALSKAWRGAEGLRAVSVETRDLFRHPLRAGEFDRYDAAVIDPPRAGAAAQIEEIACSRLTVLGHVSCNPITFARDARRLIEAGFGLDWVEVVDQFRWSTHVEIAARFSRAV